MRIADCVRCGGGIGRRDTELCHRCRAADREAARRSPCPNCRRVLVLKPDTGRCATCSRTCIGCGALVRRTTDRRCMGCRRRHTAAVGKRLCPRCGRKGLIRANTGWCGSCSRPGPEPKPPRPCGQCDRQTRRLSNGLCSRCWQAHPDRARNQADRLAATLTEPPWWLGPFADYASERMAIGRASQLVTALGALLTDGEPTHPQALLERARTPGRSAGPLARALEDFFVEHQLAFGLDQSKRLAAGRRQRRVEATPEALRPTAALFCDHMIASRERARHAGTKPRSDSTIENKLAIVRDLAMFLTTTRTKSDWATIQPDDIEAFLNQQPTNRRRRLTVTRQFFRWARKQRIVLIDPTTTLTPQTERGFKGTTLTIGEQRRLFQRWTSNDADIHPNEAVVGLLALLHALSLNELRQIKAVDINPAAHELHLPGRPHPVPLDPASFAAIEACLTHRQHLRTANPHLLVTKITRPRLTPASPAYMTHLLDPADVTIRTLRSTRLVDLLHSLDPKLVSEALGMNANGLLDYLADDVDTGRLPDPNL